MKNIYLSEIYQPNNQRISVDALEIIEQRWEERSIQHKGKNTVFDTVFLRYFQFYRKIKNKKGQEKTNSLDLFSEIVSAKIQLYFV